jgi:hypothetical protein
MRVTFRAPPPANPARIPVNARLVTRPGVIP